MSIWSKVLVGLIFVSSLPMFYLAASNMGAQNAWRTTIQEYEAALQPVLDENEQLQFGDEAARLAPLRAEQGPLDQGTPGIAQLKVALHDILLDRSRVWTDCKRNEVARDSGQASVTVEAPSPHQIKDQTVLYLFEQRDREEEGRYLGEFVVSGVADETVALTPTMTLSQRELDRLDNSQGPWVLYEILPADRHGVFVGLEEEDLNQLLPEATREEYRKHGQTAAEAGAPEERVFEGIFERQLRDYGEVFRETHLQMARLRDVILSDKTDLGFVKTAEEAAVEQCQLRDAEITQLKALLKETQDERDLVKAHREALESRLAVVREKVQQTFEENKKLAEQWAAAQEKAAQQVPGASGSTQGNESRS